MIDLAKKIVVVTGGEGFLGRAVCDALARKEAIPVTLSHKQVNLLDLGETIRFFLDTSANYCIHCAGYNGGIEFNQMYPADILYTNTIMGLNLYHACEYAQIKKLVSIMTSCAYPDTGMEDLKEDTFWNGKPNKTIRAHGISKRTLQAATEAYKSQYDFNSVSVCVTNLYGPYDTFNLVRTKVVGALIRKFVEAQIEYELEKDRLIRSDLDLSESEKPSVECWGTGKPRREFMYVDDAAEGIVQALQKYDDCSHPLNVGTGKDITIKELVDYIINAVGYEGEVFWNTNKPDGQLKKLLNVSKMQQFIQIDPTSIEKGLQKTVEWYINNKKTADARK